MRLGIALVIVVAAGCSHKNADAPAAGSATGSATGSGSSGSSGSGSGVAAGSGSAAQLASTVCMPNTHQLSGLVADDKTATVCATPDPNIEDKSRKSLLYDDEVNKPPPTCLAIDLATATWREAKPPPPVKPAPIAFEARPDADGVRVCKGATCTKLAVPPPKQNDDGRTKQYVAAVSHDGKRAVVVGDSLKGAWLFDATTGEKIKEIPTSDVGTVVFVGDLLYIATHGPGDINVGGTLYSRAGQPLGKTVDSYSAPLPLGGELYAFSDMNQLEIMNTRTGKTSAIKVRSSLPPVRAPSGKLVALSRESLAVIDPVAGTIEKQVRFPICAPKPAAGSVMPVAPSLVLYGDHALARTSNGLVVFATGGGGGPALAKFLDDRLGDPQVLAASGETVYATTRLGSACAQMRGHDTIWGPVGDGPSLKYATGTLVAADADGTFWAASEAGLDKLTKQGRRAARLGDFPREGEVVRSEPTRLVVLDLLGASRWVYGKGESPFAKVEAKERRLIAIDKTTGETAELLRGSLGFVRAMADELWIVRDGTELLSIAEGAVSATPRGALPEAATSIEVDGETVYFTPATGDRVLAAPMAGGASTLVADGLASAELLGASSDHLFVSAADPEAQAQLDQNLAAMTAVESMAWLAWSPPQRILSVPKAGGAAKELAGDLQSIRARASDAGHIYVQVATYYEEPENGCRVDNPAIWVVDKRTGRARRMNGVGSTYEDFVIGKQGVWLSTGERFDQRNAPPVFLGGDGIPDAAASAGDALFLAFGHRVVRATRSGYEVIAEVSADGLAVGGGYLYFHDAEAQQIGRIALRTGKRETVVASAPAVGAMAAHAGGVTWWAAGTQSLETASAPGAQRTLLASAPKPDGLAAGGGRVALLAGNRLIVVTAADGASRTIALGSAGLGVAGNETYVYWAEEDAGTSAAVLLRAKWSAGDRQIVSRVGP